MNRGQLTARVQSRIDRWDSNTQTLIENWINEVIRTIENAYTFDYMKRRELATLTANTNEFTLHEDLILHHPFRLRVKSPSNPNVYTHLFNMTDSFFDYIVPNATTSAEKPLYFIQRGGAHGLVCAVYPVQEQNLTMEITEGYFYTPAFTVDVDTTWLTENQPDLIVEGVSAMAHEHFFEPDKADRAFQKYNAFLNGDRRSGVYGLIPASRRRRYGNYRNIRIKTLDDFGLTNAHKMRRFAI